ncbi:MAG: contractile injection system tape measure protein, partial [Terrimicrobiaceae bacterium]
MNHLIHRVRVELLTNTRVAAIAAQEAASRALQDDLDAVEAAFDTRFPEDTTLRLDRLEVELGPLPVRGFRQAFIAALVQSLTDIDAKVIPSRPGVRISEFPRSSQW